MSLGSLAQLCMWSSCTNKIKSDFLPLKTKHDQSVSQPVQSLSRVRLFLHALKMCLEGPSELKRKF